MKLIILLAILSSVCSFAQPSYHDILVERIDKLIIENPNESLLTLMYSAYRQDPEHTNQNIPSYIKDKLANHYTNQMLLEINEKYKSEWRIEKTRTDNNRNKFIYTLVSEQEASSKLEKAINAISDDNIKKAAQDLREYAKYSRLKDPLSMGIARGIGVSVVAIPVGLFANLLINAGGAITYPFTGSVDFSNLVIAAPFITTFIVSTMMDIIDNKNALNSKEKLLKLLRKQLLLVSESSGNEVLKADAEKINKAMARAGAADIFQSIELYKKSNKTQLRLTLNGNLGIFNWSKTGEQNMSYQENLNILDEVTKWLQSYNDCSINYKS